MTPPRLPCEASPPRRGRRQALRAMLPWFVGPTAIAAARAAGATVDGRLSPAGADGDRRTRRERREVAGFEVIETDVPGELRIAQGPVEALEIEAEPVVLERISAEVLQGRLRLSMRAGTLVTRAPIAIRVGLRRLTAVEARGAQTIEIPALAGAKLQVSLDGSGTLDIGRLELRELVVRTRGARVVRIAGGTVERQQVELGGSGRYDAGGLDCRRAALRIQGNGSVWLAAADRLEIDVAGSGSIRYRGDPVLQRLVRGVASIEKM